MSLTARIALSTRASRMSRVDPNDFSSFSLESENRGLSSDPRHLYLDWPLAWEYDGELYDFAELTMHLWRASSYMMGEAIKRSQEQTMAAKLVSAMSCGTAVELLTKAFLAHVNPALVAADPISTLLLSGEVEYLPQHPKLRTRMGADVLSSARSMIESKTSTSPWTQQQQELVLEARNSVAHLGLLRNDGADFNVSRNRDHRGSAPSHGAVQFGLLGPRSPVMGPTGPDPLTMRTSGSRQADSTNTATRARSSAAEVRRRGRTCGGTIPGKQV